MSIVISVILLIVVTALIGWWASYQDTRADRKTCTWWHTWGKWSKSFEATQHVSYGTRRVWVQTRDCERCGIRDVRTIGEI